VLGVAPWSPDRTAITFTRRKTLQASTGGVYVAGGSAGVRRLAGGAREAGAWSPDGSKIIFSNASCRIRVVTLGGTISTLPVRGCLPSWQP
jgi:Tol biopolymer transport system component